MLKRMRITKGSFKKPLDSGFLKQVGELNWALWCKPEIPAFGKLRQDNQFKASIGYTASQRQP